VNRVTPAFRFCLDNSTLTQVGPIHYSFFYLSHIIVTPTIIEELYFLFYLTNRKNSVIIAGTLVPLYKYPETNRKRYDSMKKIISLFLAVILCLSLCACGKSEAAQKVDEMILAIGTVTLESESSIKRAESAYKDLTEDQKKEVENYETLTTARTTLDDLLEQKRLAEEEAARIAELQALAAEVDTLIGSIGEVTLDKNELIAEVRAAYDALTEETKGFVTLLADLEQAEADLITAQEEWNMEQATQVAALIDSIGTVSLESGNAIKVAENAYNAQTDAVKELVANAGVMIAARQEYNTQLIAYGEKNLSGLKCENDPVRGIKFYYASTFPYYDSYGYWGADVRSFVLPYMGVQGNNVWMRLVCDYTSDDWLFFEKITFAVDDQRYYRFYSYYDVTRDNGYGDIWEYVDIVVGDEEIELLRAIANSENTIVRFEGDDYYDDVTIKDSDKKAIIQMLLLYEYLQIK